MSELIKVVYVGNKPTAFDSVARSGKTWAGKGDVQEVTDVQAKALLKYPDQWALVNEADASKVAKPQSITATDEDGKKQTIDPEAFKAPIEQMTKVELVALAKSKWDKDLSIQLSKKQLLDEIIEFEATLQPVAVES